MHVVIRIAMGAQWLRAAHANPHMARYCRRWAVGIWTVQAAWIVLGFSRPPADVAIPVFFTLAVAEMAVPVWASVLPREQTAGPHPEHAEERHGLFTLIILGEMVLVASDAFNNALGGRHQHLGALITGAVVSPVLAFALWWLYFGFLGHYDLRDIRTSFIWGYGHYFIFGALTAVGAALAALLEEIAVGEHTLPDWGMALTLAVPVSLFLATVALLRRVSDSTACNPWLLAAGAVLAVGIGVGSFGPLYALVAVGLATAASGHGEAPPEAAARRDGASRGGASVRGHRRIRTAVVHGRWAPSGHRCRVKDADSARVRCPGQYQPCEFQKASAPHGEP